MYIVMEHASNGDLLEQLLKEGRAMSERRVAKEVGNAVELTIWPCILIFTCLSSVPPNAAGLGSCCLFVLRFNMACHSCSCTADPCTWPQFHVLQASRHC